MFKNRPRMRNLKTLLLLAFVLSALTGVAQERQVSGRVIDLEVNEGLPGVNVVLKGTTIGTVTDLEGRFTLDISSGEDVLVFSSVGYTTQEIVVGNQSTINVNMAPDIKALEEIVVIGYGSQKENEITSAISTVKSEDIIKTPTSQAMQALQGKVAGLQIVSNGAPGASPTVRVRGIGSFEGNAAPLYVVDGMFFDNIDFLNTNDIETISVLKDASAAAIYGVRAANGVILIETKSGSFNQKPEIVYDGYYGMQNPQNVIKMSNTEQFVQYVNEVGDPADLSFVDNAIQRYGRSRVNPALPDVNTDWYKEVMEPSSIQNHTLSFNGGSESTRYSLGVSYFDQQGLLKDTRNDYRRLNLRLKLDTEVNKWLTVGGNVNVSSARQFVGDDGAWFRSYFSVPIIPVYDDLNTDASPEQLSNAQQIGYRGNQNPFYSLLYQDNRNDIRKILGNIYAEISFIPNKLTFRTAYNYNMATNSSRNVNFGFNDGVTENLSALSRQNINSFDQIWDNYLTYQDDFDDHHITVVGGYSFRSETSELLFARGEQLVPEPTLDNEEFWYLSRALNIDISNVGDAGGGTINGRLFFQSYFARLAYNYGDRYLLYGTYRRDGNNKFQKKWGDFVTVGAGWVLSEESFFNVDFVDFLKFRGSWGQMGNDGIRPAVGAPTLEQTETAINDNLVTGRHLRPTFDLIEQWETTIETNIGLTGRFLNNRLSLEADYFIRDTENLAVSIIPPVFRDTERRSVGEIRNTGFELALNWNDDISENLSYTFGGNFTYLENEVKGLGGPLFLDAGQAEFRQRSIVGQPFQAFYGYEVMGVFQNEGEISSSGYTNEFIADNALEPGDFFFKDQNNDGVVNDEDRVVLGSYLPTFTYGFNLGVRYRNFDFSANFQGQTGHSILNRKRGEVIFTNDTNLDAELVTNLWRGEGTSDRYPSAAGLRKGWNQNMSEYFVESGSYFRIQNVQLAYNFLDQELFGTTMPDTRIILTAERPLTIFNYNGFNPEVPDGIDRQVYPIPAIYTVGLNVKF
jgi:TonB-linked SusC/RagA family outer membrane protein